MCPLADVVAPAATGIFQLVAALMSCAPVVQVLAAFILTMTAVSDRFVDAGCALVITPAVVIPVRKLFDAPVSATTIVLSVPASFLACGTLAVLSEKISTLPLAGADGAV